MVQAASLIFNRKRVALHQRRALARPGDAGFLLREMAERLCDRLSDTTRSFPKALCLDIGGGVMAEALEGKGGIEWLVQSNLSLPLLASRTTSHEPRVTKLVADEEYLPFAENIFDLVISSGALQWTNDLPGTLIQIQRSLKPDGLFLAMLPGGRTLHELRESFAQAELRLRGGISPHVSPFVDVRDAGALLQRAGFALPVADSEMLTVSYDTPIKLMHDLRDMGQASALAASAPGGLRRDVLFAMLDHYQQHFCGQDGRITASFELVTMTGWKPHASQQQPAKRGSGQMGLGEALGP
jgi:SAM-dependent methyltransferase